MEFKIGDIVSWCGVKGRVKMSNLDSYLGKIESNNSERPSEDQNFRYDRYDIANLHEKLQLAEEALRFYAGIAQPLNGGSDNESCNFGLDNSYDRGGKRAREYFKKAEEL